MINKFSKTLLVISLLLGYMNGYAFQQSGDTTVNLESKFDNISFRWDLVAQELERYDGLSQFCIQNDYRKNVINILNEIHHFDSLVYKRLKHISSRRNSGEIRKTVKQIEELETEYDIKSFTAFLNKECKDRRQVEKSKKVLKGNYGEYSYDGQKHLVENAIERYVHHVTHLIDHVRKHIHHLHLNDRT